MSELLDAIDEAVAQARKSPPGLVLADIQLADDSSGIDAVRSAETDGDQAMAETAIV